MLAIPVAVLLALALWWGWSALQQSSRKLAAGAAPPCTLPAEPAASPHSGMVWVPGGTLEMGDSLYPEEQPSRKTAVAGFWMDRTEVTNDAFAAFVGANGYVTVAERAADAKRHAGLPLELQQPGAVVFVPPGAANGPGGVTQWWHYVAGANWRHPGGPRTNLEGRGAFPVVAVTFEDAQAYARWKGRSLPSEAQWEWAARAGKAGAPAAHAQPAGANTWQGLFPVVNSGDDGFVGLAPVGCYPANAYGLFDTIGNVWELTGERWTPDHSDTSTTPPAARAAGLPPAPRQRVIKGGSYLCAPNYCMRYRAGARQAQDDDLGASHLGFRTILSAPAP